VWSGSETMISSLAVFIWGLAAGSFTNVVVYRLPRGKSIIWPKSHCPACGCSLAARDMVPLLSYMMLRGRCRCCRKYISLRYPLIEVLGGLSFLLIYRHTGSGAAVLAGWIMSIFLIAAAFIDIDHGIIPDKLTMSGLLAAVLLSPLTIAPLSAAAGVVFFGGVLWMAGVLSRGGMGGGDVKLAMVIGAFCGMPQGVAAFIISASLGGLWGLLLIMSRQGNRKTPIKFGPFLAVGGYTAYLYGSQILELYLGILGCQGAI